MVVSVVCDVGPGLDWVDVVLLHSSDYLLIRLYLVLSYDDTFRLVLVTCRIKPFALLYLLYFEPGLGVDVKKVSQYVLCVC